VLASSGVESFVIFLYADEGIQWTTGDVTGTNGLGGSEALAGINAGDGINFMSIIGSLTPNIINITKTSNVGIPGVWMFKVGSGTFAHGCIYYNAQCRRCIEKVEKLLSLILVLLLRVCDWILQIKLIQITH